MYIPYVLIDMEIREANIGITKQACKTAHNLQMVVSNRRNGKSAFGRLSSLSEQWRKKLKLLRVFGHIFKGFKLDNLATVPLTLTGRFGQPDS